MRKWVTGALVALGIVLTTGCSITTPEPDQVGVVYDAGPLSDTSFQNCIKPGSRDISGPADQAYVYPAGQRTYEFAEKPGAEAAPITVVTKDNLEMQVAGVATFTLSADCKALQQFHERLGLKFKAYEDAGWNRLLSIYVGQPLDRAMDAASKEFDWKALFNDPAAKQRWEERVKELIPGFIQEQGGASFFTGFNVTLQQPLPPQGVRDALAAAQQAAEENNAQKAKNERARTELESIKELVEVLGPDGYVKLKAVQSGQATIVISDDGKINVTPKGR
jgi:hypothetical protein